MYHLLDCDGRINNLSFADTRLVVAAAKKHGVEDYEIWHVPRGGKRDLNGKCVMVKRRNMTKPERSA